MIKNNKFNVNIEPLVEIIKKINNNKNINNIIINKIQ